MPRRQLRQITEPLEVPMMPFAVGGTAVWALAGLVMLFFRDDLVDAGRSEWLWTCLAGFLAGLVGILAMHLRARSLRRRRRGASAPGSREPSPGDAPRSPSGT